MELSDIVLTLLSRVNVLSHDLGVIQGRLIAIERWQWVMIGALFANGFINIATLRVAHKNNKNNKRA